MDFKKKIITMIMGMSGRYSPYNVFSDWIELCALSICNSCHLVHDKTWQDREQKYMDTARRYTEKEFENFAQMFVWLGDALTENMSDVLGEIYMEAEMGSKYTGQFFTPFHLSEVCARVGIKPDDLPETGRISLKEPSCGGGSMVIAACKVLHEAGFDFQRRLDVVAQDLDWKGVYMAYLQLSLIGCRAMVIQGDTLISPYDPLRTDPAHVMKTPALMGVLL